jgi:hypothetical protein
MGTSYSNVGLFSKAVFHFSRTITPAVNYRGFSNERANQVTRRDINRRERVVAVSTGKGIPLMAQLSSFAT